MDCEVIQEGAKLVAHCPEETFGMLVRSIPHWKIELLADLVGNIIQFLAIGLIWKFLIGPRVRRWWHRHHNHEICDSKE